MKRPRFQNAFDIYKKKGLAGVASRAIEIGTQTILTPLITVYSRFRALSAPNTVRTYNDYFFAEIGVSRADAESHHQKISAQSGLPVRKLGSFHHLAFAALAVSGFRPRRILEIGTETGETAEYLATLFADAEVYTVNLPSDDPIYAQWHPEGEDRHAEIATANMTRSNIRALRLNTVRLLEEELPNKFDLIWLDGGHSYPEVAWDHFYCMPRLAEGGWSLSDDITLPERDRWWHRVNLDPYRVIDYFNARQEKQFQLLLKREEPVSYMSTRKFIAYYDG